MTGAVMALSGRTVRGFLRSPQLIVSAFAFPLLMMFLMLAVLGRLVGAVDHAGYVHRLAPLVVLSTISFSASLTTVGFHFDTHGPMFDRLRAAPLPPWTLLAGRLVGDLIRIMLVAVLTTAVAYLPGFRFRVGPAAALAYFGVILLVGLMFSAAAAWIGLYAASPVSAAAVLNSPMIVLFFLSTGYLPLSAFPGFIQPVVRFNPLSVSTNTLVGLSGGGPVRGPLGLTLLWTLVVTAVAALMVVRRFRALARG